MFAMGLTEFGDPETLQPLYVPRPSPLPTEILVRVRATGVNPIDWHTRRGAPTPVAATLDGSGPFVLGWDVSGVVEEVGAGVHLFEPGDEVYGLPWFPRLAGANAEFVCAPSRQFARKPRTLDHVHAAAVPLAALTAWQALTESAQVQRGEKVLIHAAGGGVGHMAVQLARHLGAHVIATARSEKHEWLRSLGADETIDYTVERFEEIVTDADVVLDLVGDKDDTTVRSISALRAGGTLVLIAPTSAGDIHERGLHANVNVTPAILVEPDGHQLAEIARIIDHGKLRIHVEKAFPLSDAAEAHRLGEGGRTTGKIVLEATPVPV